jgi:hypothetical protein
MKMLGLVTLPSARNLSTDSNRPRQRRKKTSSGRDGGRSTGVGAGDEDLVVVDRGAESVSSTTSSTHPSLGRPYTPSLPDDSSDTDADSLWKDSTDSDLASHKGSIHRLDTPGSSVHLGPITSIPTYCASMPRYRTAIRLSDLPRKNDSVSRRHPTIG